MMKRPAMYSRPGKPLAVPVPQRDWRSRSVAAEALPAPVAVDAASECHVTPAHIADRMTGYAGRLCGCDVLEPSAGTGALARALLSGGCEHQRLTMVEMHTTLAANLRSVGPVICADFLEWAACEGAARRFDVVVMNPPFRRVKAHVSAAVSLLAPGGRLIALVPTTYTGHDFTDLETLPSDTFALAAVATKLVRIHAP